MAENTMLQDAIDAISQGEKAKAKEILTRLIKTDQQNASYWVWMSAAVATQKERIYALKTALRVDPENASAKRGLVLLGEIPPDEDIDPFPLHHPRLWEEELISEEEEEEKEIKKKVVVNPVIRLAGIGVGVIGIIGLIIFGFSQQSAKKASAVVAGPTSTYTHTPTSINAKPTNTPGFDDSLPLSDLLDVPYTPTPLYVNTPRSVQASDYSYAVEAAYANEDWEALITAMEQIATLEPESADPYYYIGEAYRFMGENVKALKAYEEAINKDEDFGPPYLGKARIMPYVNADADIGSSLDEAIEKDPNFSEAYIVRAVYFLEKEKYEKAYDDLEKARELAPNSPLVYYNLAKVYWAQDELEDALEAAEKALELDLTHLESYLLLGQLYEANGQIDKAKDILETYIDYAEEGDAEALAILGGAYYENGEYEEAIEYLDQAIKLDRYSGTAYYYRGLSYFALDDAKGAVYNLDKANRYVPDSLEISLALAEAEYLNEHYGNCYLQAEGTRPLIATDEEEALVYYWIAICHEGREDFRSAREAWETLLEITGKSAEISTLQDKAEEHLAELYTPTPTKTPKATKTPKPSRTPTSED